MLRLRKVRALASSLLVIFTSLSVIAVVPSAITTAWADNFFGTSGPDTIVGTENDDKSLDKEVMII